MTVLLWWSLASIAVSLVLGAFLGFGRRGAETSDVIDLDALSGQLASPTTAASHPVDSTLPST